MPKPPAVAQNTEGGADPERGRRFSTEWKLRILKGADGLQGPGRGRRAAPLRRGGIYTSHLTEWRKQVRAHGEAGSS